ncbi:hypothetical protein RT717_03800 [Imperialibacter roseus]|uniref:Lipocalin-like domain-containing protein n=1 Tax=Imperialibacter roseus TaxID=1324217 RepID=A0ABZ0IVT4_9BACT|nr:hypothetical protein [Imperialibacter roseus]WOK07747.1 hypothetical protein RT717_03800 [Imperialibacter roseus]
MTQRKLANIKFIYHIGILVCLMSFACTQNPKNQAIHGLWEIDSLIVEPISIPSYCDMIYKGSLFNFKSDGQLVITPKDSTQKCNSYSYKIFDDELNIVEYDMVMSASFDLTDDGYLKMFSRNLFDWDKAKTPDIETYNLLFANGITIKLKRKDDNTAVK